jgi:cation transport ATPase
MNTTTLPLTGLHCQACVRRVTDALAPLAEQVQVSLSPMQVALGGAHADWATLQAAVRSAGAYDLITAEVLEEKIPSGLDLPQHNATKIIASDEKTSFLQTYRPLLMIVAYLLAASLLVQLGQHTKHGISIASISVHETMRYFMAGFFLTFSFFKLLDLNAFADAYAGYDLLAARWRGWGYVYPFIELLLGLAYLAAFQPVFTAWVTLLVMGFSALGVIRAVISKKHIPCACLGTVFKLPMSTVTIVEDVGMVLMAAWMLLA